MFSLPVLGFEIHIKETVYCTKWYGSRSITLGLNFNKKSQYQVSSVYGECSRNCTVTKCFSAHYIKCLICSHINSNERAVTTSEIHNVCRGQSLDGLIVCCL
jgi:hypothetical protein